MGTEQSLMFVLLFESMDSDEEKFDSRKNRLWIIKMKSISGSFISIISEMIIKGKMMFWG